MAVAKANWLRSSIGIANRIMTAERMKNAPDDNARRSIQEDSNKIYAAYSKSVKDVVNGDYYLNSNDNNDNKLLPDSYKKQLEKNGFGAKDINDTNAAVNELNSNLSNNFGDKVIIELDTLYTCPSDGIVIYGGYFNAFVELTVNNLNVGTVYGGNQSVRPIYNSYKVKKGDVICIKTYSDNVIYANIHSFAPYK